MPISAPAIFDLYNKNMGFVDLHDQHCSDLKINEGGKKWTSAVLKRIISSALKNGLAIHNIVICQII